MVTIVIANKIIATHKCLRRLAMLHTLHGNYIHLIDQNSFNHKILNMGNFDVF